MKLRILHTSQALPAPHARAGHWTAGELLKVRSMQVNMTHGKARWFPLWRWAWYVARLADRFLDRWVSRVLGLRDAGFRHSSLLARWHHLFAGQRP